MSQSPSLQDSADLASASAQQPAFVTPSRPSRPPWEDSADTGGTVSTPAARRERSEPRRSPSQAKTWEDCESWLRHSAIQARSAGLHADVLERWAQEVAGKEAAATAEAAEAVAQEQSASRKLGSKSRRRKEQGWTVVERRASSRSRNKQCTYQDAGRPSSGIDNSTGQRSRSADVPRRGSGSQPPAEGMHLAASMHRTLPARHLTVRQSMLRACCRGQAARVVPHAEPEVEAPIGARREFSLVEASIRNEFPALGGSSQTLALREAGAGDRSAGGAPCKKEPRARTEEPRSRTEGSKHRQEEPAQDACGICFRPLGVSASGVLKSCGHSFHLRCLARRQSQEGVMACIECQTPFDWNDIERVHPEEQAPRPQASRAQASRAHATLARPDLARAVFRGLGPEGGAAGVLRSEHMRRFASFTGFKGTLSEWREEFHLLCCERGLHNGIKERDFLELVDDSGQSGCYCCDEELRGVLEKLKEANTWRRSALIEVFGALTEGSSQLNSVAMRCFASLCGYRPVSDREWAEEYARLCEENDCSELTGIDEAAFLAIVGDGAEPGGDYCSDKSLARIQAALRRGGDQPASSSRRAQQESGSEAASARRPQAEPKAAPPAAASAPHAEAAASASAAGRPAGGGRSEDAAGKAARGGRPEESRDLREHEEGSRREDSYDEEQEELALAIFSALDADGVGQLDGEAVRQFVVLAGVRGKADWRVEFRALCARHGASALDGVDRGTFVDMVVGLAQRCPQLSNRKLAFVCSQLLRQALNSSRGRSSAGSTATGAR